MVQVVTDYFVESKCLPIDWNIGYQTPTEPINKEEYKITALSLQGISILSEINMWISLLNESVNQISSKQSPTNDEIINKKIASLTYLQQDSRKTESWITQQTRKPQVRASKRRKKKELSE
jgi:hypothetical protein